MATRRRTGAGTLRRLSTGEELLEASGGDPLVAQLLRHLVADRPAYAGSAAVCAVHDYWDEPDVTVVGPPAAAARLLLDVAAELPSGASVSLPETALPLLPDRLLDGALYWAFRWTEQPSRRAPAWPVGRLGEESDAEVAALLDDSFADAAVRPGSRHVRGWVGIRDADGRLLACAADCTEAADLGFIASIASRRDRRGTGLGAAVTAWLTDELHAAHGRVGLWHYGANATASALYDRLGYHDEHRMVTGRLVPPAAQS